MINDFDLNKIPIRVNHNDLSLDNILITSSGLKIIDNELLGCNNGWILNIKNSFLEENFTYQNFLTEETLMKLWKIRKDFEVWVPLAESKEREYMTIDKYDRKGYFSKLSSCYVGVCAKQKYSGWAISATDGMSVGVPYLFSDDDYYHELANDAGLYYNDNEFVDKIDNLLDMENLRNEWADKSLKRFEQGKWENAIIPFNNMINDTIKNLPMLKNDTETYKKVVDFIHRKKSVTKSDILNMLNWGVRISFSGYRNRLRNEPTIRFTKNRYEVI